MDLEDIIYIVVTIVIIIVSLLGKSKKKPEPIIENYEEDEYSLNEFEKLLERRQEYMKSEKDEDEQVDYDTSNTIELGKAVKSLYEQKGNNFTNKSESKSIEKTVDKDEEIEEYIHEDGFDVKSAIIYSSILERKKFRN